MNNPETVATLSTHFYTRRRQIKEPGVFPPLIIALVELSIYMTLNTFGQTIVVVNKEGL
jgi:hypothetical protein